MKDRTTAESYQMFCEIERLDNGSNWIGIIDLLNNYWDSDYGAIRQNGNEIELITGGWSENEEIIKDLSNTMFWFLFWQESKRGGYYKFVWR